MGMLSFMASVFRMKWSLQKSMHGLMDPFHTPYVVSLQTLEQREGVEIIMVSHIF